MLPSIDSLPSRLAVQDSSFLNSATSTMPLPQEV